MAVKAAIVTRFCMKETDILREAHIEKDQGQTVVFTEGE